MNRGPARSGRRGRGAAAAVVVAVAVLASSGAATPAGVSAMPSAGFRLAADDGTRPNLRRASASDWWGGAYSVAAGDVVRVFMSSSYPRDEGLVRRWADFFGALLHGSELARLTAYIAPLREVEELCSEDALGCYGNNVLVTMGDPVDGISPESVAAHEYGHHVAHNRANAPWRAIDWGTKRWASFMNICSRAAAGAVFPGDEGERYSLNPGEGYAEAYRVLTERRSGATVFEWPIVDRSFYPDDAALAAIDEDVRVPWSEAPARTVSIRSTASAARSGSWRIPLSTPLDGRLAATLRVGRGAVYELTLLAGTKVVARGLWSSATTLSLPYTVCGERSLVLRVVRKSGSRRFVLRLAAP